MGFLRRLIGGGGESRAGGGAPAPSGGGDSPASDGAPGAGTGRGGGGAAGEPAGTAPQDDEAARELELLRAEQARLSDDLLARQLRYADRSWTPPAQGGPRRTDDPDADAG